MVFYSPIDKRVFDMIAGRVDEYTAVVPGAALDADILMDHTQILQLAVTDGDGCNGSS